MTVGAFQHGFPLKISECNDVSRAQWFMQRGESIAWLTHPEFCITDFNGALHMKLCDADSPTQSMTWNTHLGHIAVPGSGKVATRTSSIDYHADLLLKHEGCSFQKVIPPVKTKGANVVEVYYEALCRECIKDISELPYYAGRLATQDVTWKIVPYGLPLRSGDHMECPHGWKECEANKYSACALSLAGGSLQAIPFLSCLESMMKRSRALSTTVRVCTERSAPFEWKALRHCAESRFGDELIKDAGNATRNARVREVSMMLVNQRKLPASWLLLDVIGKEPFVGRRRRH